MTCQKNVFRGLFETESNVPRLSEITSFSVQEILYLVFAIYFMADYQLSADQLVQS